MSQRRLKKVTYAYPPGASPAEAPLRFAPGDEYPDWAEQQFDQHPEVYYEPETGPSEPEMSYHDMKVSELQALCTDRGIEPKSSKKGDLIEALDAYDAHH